MFWFVAIWVSSILLMAFCLWYAFKHEDANVQTNGDIVLWLAVSVIPGLGTLTALTIFVTLMCEYLVVPNMPAMKITDWLNRPLRKNK